MNKEEIKKAIKALICSQCGKCYFPKRRNCRACLEKNRRMIKKYIKQLEQKEAILDRVTEECRKQMTTYEDSILEIFPQKILNIIEERQYCCNCGVELNSENKALDNMCNECKYRIRLLKERR